MADKKIRVLEIAEDEDMLLKVMSSQFDRKEFDVLTATDGEQGLAVALSKHPDLILLDLLMPKMDGITMLKHLREDSWGKNVPVIILTAFKDVNHINEVAKFGVTDYLVKSDFQLSEIVEKVKQKLGMK